MTALPKAARIYICAVAAIAIAAGGLSLPSVRQPGAVLGLCALIIVCATASEVTDSGNLVSVSLAFVVGIAAIFITGAAGAVFVAAAASLSYARGGRPLVKRVFNGAQYSLSAAVGGLVFDAMHGPVGHLSQRDFPGVIFVLMAVSLTYWLCNQLLVGAIVSLSQSLPVHRIWRQATPWTSSPYLAYGFLSLLMAALWENFGDVTAVLLLIPLMVTRTTFANFVAQQRAYDATVAALIQAVETKDHYTRGHSERVSGGSVLIAGQLGLREDRVKALRYAGMLHDVGKMGVPTKVLQKQGRLTAPEADAVRAHPGRGLEMLGDIEFLQEALSGIYHHHERMDGKGYPLGLKGMEIPEFARVIMVADAFDSMTSNRSYRPAMSIESAIDELIACSGVQFDPAMVEAMVTALRTHGWQVQGADEPRLPVGQPSQVAGPEAPVLPRQYSAYSSVETES